MPKLSNKKLLAVAILLSLMTATLVYNYLKGAARTASTQGVSVVVSKIDIPPKTKITPEMVSEIKVPPEYIQPGAVQSLDKVLGVIVREQIITGEQISERRLVREGKTVGFTGMIPRDKRAITIAVTEVTGVAGFVKAGDYVDVVVTFDAVNAGDNVSSVILQNILVLAYNHDAEILTPTAGSKESTRDTTKEIAKAATVTMAVSPDEAARVTLAEERGKIRLALRPYLPLDPIAITEVVTPADLVGIHISPLKNGQSTQSMETRQPVYAERQTAPATKIQTSEGTTGIQVIRGTKIEK